MIPRQPFLVAALALLMVVPALAGPPPGRIVSLSLCTDQLLVLLADRAQIAALSPLARDPGLSFVAARAFGFRLVGDSREELPALAPDLVLTGAAGGGEALGPLAARGVPVLYIGEPDSFATVGKTVRRVAVAVGHPARGDRLLAAMTAMLEGRVTPTPPAVTVLLLPAGFTAAEGTLWHEVLSRAGLVNHAAGRRGYPRLPAPLEGRPPPDLIVQAEGAGALAPPPPGWRGLAVPRLPVDAALIACGGPWTASLVSELAAAARAALTPVEPPASGAAEGARP